MIYILFLIWFYLVVKWADFLVDWACWLAKRFNIPDLVIWLTIVAFWTSAPELVVNVMASIAWNSDIVMWNILWSNIANILLILWICAIITPIFVSNSTIWKEIPFSLLAVIVLGIFVNDQIFNQSSVSLISIWEWLILISFLVIFMYYIYWLAKNWNANVDELMPQHCSIKKWTGLFFLWLLMLVLWWKWIVDWAIQIAQNYWISQKIISLTIVAIWTSFPELATSVVAAMKKKADIVVGNIIWSNIFNIFWILWISAVINPINLNSVNNVDILVLLFSTLILFLSMFMFRKMHIVRFEWVLFVAFYVLYIWYSIFWF